MGYGDFMKVAYFDLDERLIKPLKSIYKEKKGLVKGNEFIKYAFCVFKELYNMKTEIFIVTSESLEFVREALREHGLSKMVKVISVKDYSDRQISDVYNKNQDKIVIVDNDSKIGYFKECGKKIAINFIDSLIGKVDVIMKTDDLREVLKHL